MSFGAFRRSLTLMLLLAVFPSVASAQAATPTACAASLTSSPVRTAASPAANGEVELYRADWSCGLAGWRFGSDWQVVEGLLKSGGTSSEVDGAVAPYQPNVSEYAITAEMRVLSTSGSSQDCPQMFVSTFSDDGTIRGGVACGSSGSLDASLLYFLTGGSSVDADSRNNSSVRISIGDWHVYRLEIREGQFGLLVDGFPVLEERKPNFTGVGPEPKVGFAGLLMEVEVRGFRVIALV